MDYHTKLASTLFEFAQNSSDFDVLTKLSEMARSLKPLLDQDTNLPEELGQELWLYIGVKRDADNEMAERYMKRIAKLFH